MSNIRIAMLGSGFVAGFYMQGLANVNGQQVVLNYSRSARRAREFAAAWAIPESTTNLSDAIARDGIDLYIIALPNEEHLPVSLELSKARRHQVCTKPLARNRGEAKKMFEAARRSGRIHGYAETEVFAPCVIKARETIVNGGIGRVHWVRSRESHSGPHSPHFWDIEKTGGGAMNDLACHCVEAARYFFGKEDEIVEVMAWGATLVHQKKTKGRTTRSSSSSFQAAASATVNFPGPPRAASICATKSTGRKVPFSPTSLAERPLHPSPPGPPATSSKRPTSISDGRALCRRRRSPMATRARCGTSSNARRAVKRPAKPTKTAIKSTVSSTPATSRCARKNGFA